MDAAYYRYELYQESLYDDFCEYCAEGEVCEVCEPDEEQMAVDREAAKAEAFLAREGL